MAVDEALLESVRRGGAPTLRLYGWSPPCVSLGRNQPALGHYPLSEFRALGIGVVRRSTGGRAVLHDDEVTYSVVAPDRAFGTARGAYRATNEMLLSALGTLGAPCVLAENGAAAVPSTVPCFADPAAGEIMVQGRKLVGSAQVRADGVLLQHGSILLRRSPLLSALAGLGFDGLDGRAAYLASALGGEVDPDRVIGAISEEWGRRMGPLVEEGLTSPERARVATLTARFEDDAWTWRG